MSARRFGLLTLLVLQVLILLLFARKKIRDVPITTPISSFQGMCSARQKEAHNFVFTNNSRSLQQGQEDMNEEQLVRDECKEGRICRIETRPGLGQMIVCEIRMYCGAPREIAVLGIFEEQQCQLEKKCGPVFRPGLGKITLCRNDLVCG